MSAEDDNAVGLLLDAATELQGFAWSAAIVARAINPAAKRQYQETAARRYAMAGAVRDAAYARQRAEEGTNGGKVEVYRLRDERDSWRAESLRRDTLLLAAQERISAAQDILDCDHGLCGPSCLACRVEVALSD
jgi:hypothetical protein